MQDRTTAVGFGTLLVAMLAVMTGPGVSRRTVSDPPSPAVERETEPSEPAGSAAPLQ